MLLQKNKLFRDGLNFIPKDKRPEYFGLLAAEPQSAVSAQSLPDAQTLRNETPYPTQNLALDLRITRFVIEHGNENKQAFLSKANAQLQTQVDQLRALETQLSDTQDKEKLTLCVSQGTLLGEHLSQQEPIETLRPALDSYEKHCQSLDPGFFERSWRELSKTLKTTFVDGFENQAKIAKLQERIKESQSTEEQARLSEDLMHINAVETNRVYQINKASQSISHAFSIVAMLASFSDNPSFRNQANKVAIIANASCTIINNIACFGTIAAASGPLAPIVAIVGAISTIFQLFNTGPSELQIVSEQIERLSQQLDQFRREMHGHFIEISKQMATGFNLLAEHVDHRFNRIEDQLRYLQHTLIEMDQFAFERFSTLHQQLQLLQSQTGWIRQGLDQLLTQIDVQFREFYQRDRIDMANQALFFHQRTPYALAKLPRETISKYYIRFLTWIQNDCRSSILTGEGRTLGEALSRQGAVANTEYAISPLLQNYYDYRKKPMTTRPVNPAAYLQSVELFTSFIMSNPEVVSYEILGQDDLIQIAQLGQNLEESIREIKSSPDFISHLIAQYRETVKKVIADIKQLSNDTPSGKGETLAQQVKIPALAQALTSAQSEQKKHTEFLKTKVIQFDHWQKHWNEVGIKTWWLAHTAGLEPTFAPERWSNPCFEDTLGKIGYLIHMLGINWSDGNNYAAVNRLVGVWNNVAENVMRLRYHSYETEKEALKLYEELRGALDSTSQGIIQSFQQITEQANSARHLRHAVIDQNKLCSLLDDLRRLKSTYEYVHALLKTLMQHGIRTTKNLTSTLMKDDCKIGPEGWDSRAEKMHPEIDTTRGYLGKFALLNETGALIRKDETSVHPQPFCLERASSYPYHEPVFTTTTRIDNYSRMQDLIRKWNDFLNHLEGVDREVSESPNWSDMLITCLEKLIHDINEKIETVSNLKMRAERNNAATAAKIALEQQGFWPNDLYEEYLSCYLNDHERDELNGRIREAALNQAHFRAHLEEMNHANLVLRAYIQLVFPSEYASNTALHMQTETLCGKAGFEQLLSQHSGKHPQDCIHFRLQKGLLEELLPELEKNLTQLATRSRELSAVASHCKLPQPSGYPLTAKALGYIDGLLAHYFGEQARLYQEQGLEQILQVAARQGNAEAVLDCINRGVNPHTQVNLTAEMMPEEPEIYREEHRSTLAWLVVAARRVDLLEFFLRTTNADPSLQNDWGWSPMHQAAYMGAWATEAVGIVETLLKHPRSRLTFFRETKTEKETPIDIARRALRDANSPEAKTRCNHVLALLEAAYAEEQREHPNMRLHA